jgi:hypothetical protein
MRNKTPRNKKGEPHGFWQTYGGLLKEFSAHFVDGEPMGYLEYNNRYSPKQNTKKYYAR